MIPVRAWKYAAPLLLYAACFIAFQQHGINAWLPMIYAWVCIPLIELLLRPDEKNLSAAENYLNAAIANANTVQIVAMVCRRQQEGRWAVDMQRDPGEQKPIPY